MNLLEHINLYFGTEFKTVDEFIKDFRIGDLSDDYDNAEDAVIRLLMFISSVGRHI